jgi:hypothetical protein
MSTRIENPIGPRDPQAVHVVGPESSMIFHSESLLGINRPGKYKVTNLFDKQTKIERKIIPIPDDLNNTEMEDIILRENGESVELPVVIKGMDETEPLEFHVKVINEVA